MMSNDKLLKADQRAKAFTQGVIIDTLRGPHSTGLVYTDSDGSAEVYKKPIPGYDFVCMPKYNEILNDPEDHPFLIAHNRWATKGAVNTANAHPFQHEHITGVHNGSLWTYRDLAPDENFATDSEYIFHALAHNDTGEVLKEIDGAFALVWHDSRDNTIHIARNDERPFHLAHIKNSDTVLGASEMEMLDLMCIRNGLEVGEKYCVNTEVELTFKLDDLHNPDVVEREMADYWNGYYSKKPKRSTTGTSTYTGKQKKDVVNFIEYDKKTVRGVYSTFVMYANTSAYGYIEGISLEEPYDVIRINGFTQREIELIDMKDEYFEGELSADGKLADGTTYMVLNRNEVKWLTKNEAMEGYEDDGVEEEAEEVEKKYYSKEGGNTLFTKICAEDMLKHGCCTCGDPIELSDFETIEWWNAEPICKGCSTIGNDDKIIGV